MFATSALVSWSNPASAQFVDRITRPCPNSATARGLVQVTTTDILINPCPGGSATINGVPITPGGGGTVTGTGTTNNLTKWTNGAGGVLGDSRIVDTGTVIRINGGTGNVNIGDVGFIGNSTLIAITDASRFISLQSLFVQVTGELITQKAIRTNTASNTDVAGRLTVGAGGTITYTFTQTYVTAPVCVSSDTNAAPMITGCSASTTTLTVTGTVGHVVNYQVIGLN